jgi:hypothetical protein
MVHERRCRRAHETLSSFVFIGPISDVRDTGFG